MNNRLIIFSVYLFSLYMGLIGLTSAQATTVIEKDFDALATEADGVVEGTVIDIQSHYDTNSEIYTFVTLNDLDIIYGQYEDQEITIRLKGGEIEGDRLEISGSPQFQEGERFLIFMEGNGEYIVPIVGWTQGLFRVVQDKSNGKQIIKDYNHNRVFGIRGSKLIKEQKNKPEFDIVALKQKDKNQNSMLYGHKEQVNIVPITVTSDSSEIEVQVEDEDGTLSERLSPTSEVSSEDLFHDMKSIGEDHFVKVVKSRLKVKKANQQANILKNISFNSLDKHKKPKDGIRKGAKKNVTADDLSADYEDLTDEAFLPQPHPTHSDIQEELE